MKNILSLSKKIDKHIKTLDFYRVVFIICIYLSHIDFLLPKIGYHLNIGGEH